MAGLQGKRVPFARNKQKDLRSRNEDIQATLRMHEMNGTVDSKASMKSKENVLRTSSICLF